MNDERLSRIEQRLRQALQPSDFVIKDQSHLHAGHAGAEEGKGHYEVRIVAEAFSDCSLMQRHRLVFEALGDLMQTDIHALKIVAKTPDEA